MVCGKSDSIFFEANKNYDRPWLFSVNIFDPHHPFDPPKEYLERYLERLNEIPLPIFTDGELNNKPMYQRIDHDGAYGMKGHLAYSEMDENDHRILRAAYWAMIDLIDEQVGRMVDSLVKQDSWTTQSLFLCRITVNCWAIMGCI